MNIKVLSKGFIRILIAVLLFIVLCSCICDEEDDDEDNKTSNSVQQSANPAHQEPGKLNPIATPEGVVKRDTTGQSDASGTPGTGESGSTGPGCGDH